MPRLTKAQLFEIEQRKQIVDEFGALDQELAAVKAKLRRREELAKAIRSWHADADAESTHTSSGDEYEVILGAREMETHLAPMPEIFQALGKEKFLEACSMTVKGLQAAAEASVVLRLTRKEQTGSRSLVVRAVEKAKAA